MNESTTTQASQPIQKFYKKELLSNRLALPNGKTVPFDQAGDSDTGIIATSDAGLISELDKAAAAGRGGVVSISEQEFQDLKKNPPKRRLGIRSFDAQSIKQIIDSRSEKVGAVRDAAVVKQESSAPMEVPKGIATTSTRRKLKEMTEATKSAPSVA